MEVYAMVDIMDTIVVPKWYSEPLSPHGVRVVQRKLLLTVTGLEDQALFMALSGWQWHTGLPVTGRVDVVTAAALGESEEYATPPEWYTLNLFEDADAVDRFLAQMGKDRGWLLRLQGTNGHEPDGWIDVDTAWLIEREK
jgi:hypothetical protein